MKTVLDKRLFWFLKEGAELDLSNKTHLDMYVQQTLSRGKFSDVKGLLQKVSQQDFIESFNRIKNFLQKEVRRFWEETIGDINKPPEKLRRRFMKMAKELHGWDDEKIYFWDEERKKDWCVSDEEELYKQLVEICKRYFEKKIE